MERVKFVGIDRFNRPVFKSLDKQRHFYGDIHNLFSYGANESEVLQKVTADDLCYFGSRFDCEPYGTPVDNLKIVVDMGKITVNYIPSELTAVFVEFNNHTSVGEWR